MLQDGLFFKGSEESRGQKDDRQHVPPRNFSLEVEELILPDLIMRIGQSFGFRVRLWVPMRPPTRSTNAFFLEKLGFLKDWKDRADPKTFVFSFLLVWEQTL